MPSSEQSANMPLVMYPCHSMAHRKQNMLSWAGHDGYSTGHNASEAANGQNPCFSYNRSPKWESSQLQQPQQRDNKQPLQSQSSALSPATKVHKGCHQDLTT